MAADYTNYKGYAQGLALQGKPTDYTSLISHNILANQDRLDKKKKAEEDDIAKMTEFDASKFKDLYPALASQALKEQVAYRDKVYEAYQKGGAKAAKSVAFRDAPFLAASISQINAKNQIARKREQDISAGAWYEGSPEMYSMNGLYNPNTDPNTLNFSDEAYKLPDYQKMASELKPLSKVDMGARRQVKIPGTNEYTIIDTHKPVDVVVDNLANDILGNEASIKYFRKTYGDKMRAAGFDIDNPNQIERTKNMLKGIGEIYVKPLLTYEKEGQATVPQPSEGDKKQKQLIGDLKENVDIQAAVAGGSNVMRSYKNVQATLGTPTATVPVQNIAGQTFDTEAVGVAKDLPSNFDFKPSNVIDIDVKTKDGKYIRERRILGQAVYYDAAGREKAAYDLISKTQNPNRAKKLAQLLVSGADIDAETKKLLPTEEEITEQANRNGAAVKTRRVTIPYEPNKNMFGDNAADIDKKMGEVGMAQSREKSAPKATGKKKVPGF